MGKALVTWLCPICAEIEMKYGTTCDDEACGNEPHITGQFYRKPKKDVPVERSIGIAQISDEDTLNNNEGM